MTVQRMDNVGIVVEDLDAAVGFFTEVGLILGGLRQLRSLTSASEEGETRA